MATSSSNLHGEYKPSRALAIVVCVIFIVLSLVQIWRIIRTQRWFGFTIVIGGLFEIAGLAARMYSCTHRNDQDSYGAQIILIILAPNFFAALIYTLLGRLIETTTTSERSSASDNSSSTPFNFLYRAIYASTIVPYVSSKVTRPQGQERP
ncbi:hypothetical protein DER45DRAFT_617325 [Fusarium avenaceum]|nr:hypothetical protein DER45DRAFT_617325 [Fusarium avenaceum]